MSDDEDRVFLTRSTKTIHYGSLEDSERQRQSVLQDDTGDDKDSKLFKELGQIQTSNEYFDLEESEM